MNSALWLLLFRGAVEGASSGVAPSYACARLEAVRGLAGLEATTARARLENLSATARIEAPRGTKS